MIWRWGRRCGTLLAAMIGMAGAGIAAEAGDAARPAPGRIVAIGDLHGDWSAWRDIARDAGLVDANGSWTGGSTVLVQTGDVPDRGPDTLKIVQDLMRLQREAPRSGGRVIAMVGNHEAMNVTGDLRYVSAGEYAAFVDSNSERRRAKVFDTNRATIESAYRKAKPGMSGRDIQAAWNARTPLGLVEHQLAWRPNGEIGRWAIGNPGVVLLGGTLFVHGGLSAAYIGRSIDDMNRRIAAALKARDTADSSIINDQAGPLWYRGLARKPGAPAETAPEDGKAPVPLLSVEEELAKVLAAFGADRMVIGHTPNLPGIAILNEGRLVRIDTGISAVYGGTLTWLEIVDGRLVPHVVARSAPASEKGK